MLWNSVYNWEKSNTESESEDSNDIPTTNTSTDNNTVPGYARQIDQRNDNLQEVSKTKSKITKNVNSDHDIRVGIGKQKPEPRNYNNI